MNTRTLTIPSYQKLFIGLVAVAILAMATVFALSAFAQVGPTVTTTVHNSAHTNTGEAAIGTLVHASASVATTTGTTTPTGTVDFTLYPTSTSCTGTSTVQAGVPLVNGVAESATTTVPNTGLSYLVRYNGGGSEVPSEGTCTALVATGPNAVISTTLSTSSVLVGTSVHDTATLANVTANATGTVAYSVYTNSACSAGVQNAGTTTVAAGVVPNSNSIQFNTPGTYYWQAVYSGDQRNAAATSTCTSEILTVRATSTPAARLVVDKVTIPAGATTTFSFLTRGEGYTNFTLTDAASPNNQELTPGTYSVREEGVRGWKLTSVMCSRNNATSSAYRPGTAIELQEGETVRCTFTNTQATSTGGGDDHDDKHDNGKHRGFILGLPFGILKKVFEEVPLPPGIVKNFGGFLDDELVDVKIKSSKKHKVKYHDDEDEDEDDDNHRGRGKGLQERMDKIKDKFNKKDKDRDDD